MLLIGGDIPICFAQTYYQEQVISTYGLYTHNPEIIKSGMVKFDLTNAELLSNSNGFKRSEYQVKATNKEVEFAIPFISSARNVPQISITVGGQEVTGRVWYGESIAMVDKEFVYKKTYSPDLDESIMGTLYSIIPNSDTVTVDLKFTKCRGFIYDTSNKSSASHSIDGSYSWTLEEALSKNNYSFYILGEQTDYAFECSSSYKTETISCKQFVNRFYEDYKELYEEGGAVSKEVFYSVMNKVLNTDTIMSFDELFFHSADIFRVNAYKFSITLENDAIISYEMPISVLPNHKYKPYIYLVEQKKVGEYSTKYFIELNDETSHIIESNTKIIKENVGYTVETTEDLYFVFSSSKNPQYLLNTNNGYQVLLIVCIVVGSIALVSLIVLIGIGIHRRWI